MEKGYSFLQVKTVQMGIYENYDKTNLFYSREGKVRMMQACLHHPSAPARVKYPAPLGRILPRNRKVPLEKLGHAPLPCSGVFDCNAGFKEFEVFPMLWDENNPCQIYVMALSLADSNWRRRARKDDWGDTVILKSVNL